MATKRRSSVLSATVEPGKVLQDEERFRTKTEDFESAYHEIDVFTRSITHGLRNNLQTISGFSQTLLKFYCDCLDETGKDCLVRIQAGTRKMKVVMESLAEFSRISSREIHPKQVDLSELARSSCDELQNLEPQRSVECIVALGLNAFADEPLARIVLDNLIQNAWKFTSKNDRPRVEFGSLDEGRRTVFFVRDNGMGFDQAQTEKLFQPLQHIHREETLKGAGMGLAMVKRIVLRHGGSVWAQGEKGKGATFFFSFAPVDRG